MSEISEINVYLLIFEIAILDIPNTDTLYFGWGYLKKEFRISKITISDSGIISDI